MYDSNMRVCTVKSPCRYMLADMEVPLEFVAKLHINVNLNIHINSSYKCPYTFIILMLI